MVNQETQAELQAEQVRLSADTTGNKTPLREFLLLPWGKIDTTQGTLQFTRKGAQEVLRRYQSYTRNRDGYLDIDIAHLSQTDIPGIEAHSSAGKFRIELRNDGLWATDIAYTPDAYSAVADERLKYYSPVVMHGKDGEIVELQQLALTNIPSMHIVQPLALSITAKRTWPVDTSGAWDKDEADSRVRKHCGSKDGSLEGVDLKEYAQFWAYVDDPEKPSTWKGLIGDIREGKQTIVRRAVQALAGAIQGARGGLNIPEAELPKLKSLIEYYYKSWGDDAPWKSENSTGGHRMAKLHRLAFLSIAFSNLGERPALLEDKSSMMDLFKAVSGALYREMPEAHLEDIYDDHMIVGIPSKAAALGESYMKVPYAVKDGKVALGEAVKVVKQWAADGEKVTEEAMKEEASRMSARVKQVEQMLLTATGKASVSAAIGEVERLRGSEESSKALSARLERLEARNFDVERVSILSDAKRSGKWTAGLEKLALSNADRARKLGEDPVGAMREVFDSAPVSVSPEVVVQLETRNPAGSSPNALSAEEEAICKEMSARTGLSLEEYKAAFSANRRMLRAN